MAALKPSLRPVPATRRSAVVVTAQSYRAHAASAASVAAAVVFWAAASPVTAAGIESIDVLPDSVQTPSMFAGMAEGSKSKLDAAEETFQQSGTLKELLARSEANKAKNKKEIQNKYCYRQAELGIGDCGGLRFIPGLTESGKQKTPEWLSNLLGVEPSQEDPTGGRKLMDLIENGTGGGSSQP